MDGGRDRVQLPASRSSRGGAGRSPVAMRLRPAHIVELPNCALTCAIAIAPSTAADWSRIGVVPLLLLAGFALIADRFEIRSRTGSYISGTMPVFVLVAVLTGPAPAAAIGAVVMLVQ